MNIHFLANEGDTCSMICNAPLEGEVLNGNNCTLFRILCCREVEHAL